MLLDLQDTADRMRRVKAKRDVANFKFNQHRDECTVCCDKSSSALLAGQGCEQGTQLAIALDVEDDVMNGKRVPRSEVMCD